MLKSEYLKLKVSFMLVSLVPTTPARVEQLGLSIHGFGLQYVILESLDCLDAVVDHTGMGRWKIKDMTMGWRLA